MTSPCAKEPHASPARPDEILNLLGLGKKLAKAVFCQARYQDWVGVESINDQVLRFDKQVIDLKSQIIAGNVDFHGLIPAANALLPRWYENDAAGQAKDRTQLKEIYRKEWDELQAAPTAEHFVPPLQGGNTSIALPGALPRAIISEAFSLDLGERVEPRMDTHPYEWGGGELGFDPKSSS